MGDYALQKYKKKRGMKFPPDHKWEYGNHTK